MENIDKHVGQLLAARGKAQAELAEIGRKILTILMVPW